MKRLTIALVLLLTAGASWSQNKTISDKQKTEREVAAEHKALIIPFEPRMYFGEVDMAINMETKLTSKEIRFKFRDGLNEQLYKAFKASGYNCLDLMEDTAKYRKDIEGIYQYLKLEYQKVPSQDNYQAPKKEKEKTSIEKGQLNVETNSDARFMNAKLTNAKVAPLLYGKYKTDLFVFINQLDIRAGGATDPSILNAGSVNRRIIVHYTVYSLDAKEINSGIIEEEFDQAINNPKKIVELYFSKIAATLVKRVGKGIGAGTK